MLQKPKGTYDIYGDRALEMLYFRKLVEALMDKYNAKYFETPLRLGYPKEAMQSCQCDHIITFSLLSNARFGLHMLISGK